MSPRYAVTAALGLALWPALADAQQPRYIEPSQLPAAPHPTVPPERVNPPTEVYLAVKSLQGLCAAWTPIANPTPEDVRNSPEARACDLVMGSGDPTMDVYKTAMLFGFSAMLLLIIGRVAWGIAGSFFRESRP